MRNSENICHIALGPEITSTYLLLMKNMRAVFDKIRILLC